VTTRYITHLDSILKRLKKKKIRMVMLSSGFADVEASPDFLKPVDYSRNALKKLAKSGQGAGQSA